MAAAQPRSPNAIVKDLHRRMQSKGKAARREISKSYFPTKMKVFGVTVPDLRAAVRDLSKELKPAAAEDVLQIAQAIVDGNGFEPRQVAFEVVKRHKPASAALTLKRIEALGHGNDNWASVDGFACDVAGPAWREGLIKDAAVHRWCRSKDRWWRRTALVCTVALNMKSRGGSGDSPRTIDICERLAADQDEMVAKALSWALRTLLAIDEPAVQRFLGEHEDVLAKRVLREVRNKLDTGLKTPKGHKKAPKKTAAKKKAAKKQAAKKKAAKKQAAKKTAAKKTRKKKSS